MNYLTNLTPAPWTAEGCEINGPTREMMVIYDEGGHGPEDATFIALARNAFDVMLRRGWWASKDSPWVDPDNPWIVEGLEFLFDYRDAPQRCWPDPFTALVEADQWYKENVEKHTP